MIDLQDTEQLLEYISSAPKSTPSVFFLKLNRRLDFPDCDVFGYFLFLWDCSTSAV